LQLEELAKTYGLPLHKTGGRKESIFVAVGAIQTVASLSLPGFKSTLETLIMVITFQNAFG